MPSRLHLSSRDDAAMKYLVGYTTGVSTPLVELEIEADGYNWHTDMTVIFYITEPHGFGTKSKTVFEICARRTVFVTASRSKAP
jgi:hypothetical protein